MNEPRRRRTDSGVTAAESDLALPAADNGGDRLYHPEPRVCRPIAGSASTAESAAARWST